MKDLLFKLPDDYKILKKRLSPRKNLLDSSLIADITTIFKDVAASGDSAVIEATERFDHIKIDSVKVSDEYITQCLAGLSPKFKNAVEKAINNIKEVNEALMPETYWRKEIRQGTIIGEKISPLESVGLYIPARKGPLVSTALMLVTAARVAGVKNIVVGMPPQEDGQANPSTVAAARIAGADRIVIGNGVSVLAGMTIGTKSIPEVDGMFGPGPAGIAAAMSIAFSYGKKTVVGIGPTDCAVIADDSADPDWIARNMMCEAEHGPDSSVLFATSSEKLAEKVAMILFDRIPKVNEKRRPILSKVFGKDGMGAIAVVPDINKACEIIDKFAPEHLMVACSADAQEKILSKIQNAGEILLGHNTPFSAANYAIGITAVLPTNGFARAFSGITCKDMIKTSTIGSLSEDALLELNDTIEALGEHEGLPCHVEAAVKNNISPCMIYIDKNGKWFHKGIHKGIINEFYRDLSVDSSGKYLIIRGQEKCYLEVEDTPFIINRVEFDNTETTEARIVLYLIDDTREDLDADTLRVGSENVLYCMVKNNTFKARFGRAAYYQLASLIKEEGDKYYLPLNDKKYYIKS